MHVLTASTLALTTLTLAACSGPEPAPEIEKGSASIADAVLAVRMSPQVSDIGAGASGGHLLLVDDAGGTRVVEIGAVDVGQLAWGPEALFASGPSQELALTDDGMQAHDRGSEEAYETSRFLTPGGEGFVAVYNVGFEDDGYLHRVASGNGSEVTSWDAKGLFSAVGQCGDLVVGITDTAEAGPDLTGGTASVDTASGASGAAEALVQLHPEPESPEASLLATVPVLGAFEFEEDAKAAPCLDGVLVTPAFHYLTEDGSDPGVPVLRAWDTKTGEHSVRPLVDERGDALPLAVDDILSNPGVVVGDFYRWISWCCGDEPSRVFTTDLRTGTTTHDFDIPLASPETGESQFFLTEESIFVLDVDQDGGAPLDLSRYDAQTGERETLLEVVGAGPMREAGSIIRDIALDPEWAHSLAER